MLIGQSAATAGKLSHFNFRSARYSFHSSGSGVLPVFVQRSKHILHVPSLLAACESSVAFRGTLHFLQMNGKGLLCLRSRSAIVSIGRHITCFSIDKGCNGIHSDFRRTIHVVIVPSCFELLIHGRAHIWADGL